MVSYPEDQSVHQTVNACTLELGATAVLHQFGVWACNKSRCGQTSHRHCAHAFLHVRSHTHTRTCEDDQAVAGLRVAKDTSSQQHILVGQGVLLVSPVQRPTETIQLVVRGLAHHFTFTQTPNVKIINSLRIQLQ